MFDGEIIGEKYWRMPGKYWARDRFWTRRGNYRNFKWGLEVSNTFGFALAVRDLGEDRSLNIHLVWPGIYIKLGPAEDCDPNNQKGWGFCISGIGGLHAYWGKRYKIFDYPWGKKHVRHEVLMQDGSWQEGWRDIDGQWEANGVPWFYRSRSCEKQEGKAKLTVVRGIWRGKLLPFNRTVVTSIDVEFDGEVGSEAGSWKGGTVGCGYDLKSGETPIECFNRMMRERSFDRR